MKKAQASTEYLIILAVVIIVALIVVGIMGWFPGISSVVTEEQSRAYWGAVSPLAIVDYAINGTTATIVLENRGTDRLQLTDIKFDGTSLGITTVNFTAGSKGTATGTVANCPAGTTFSYDVTLVYNNLDTGVTGKTFTGTTKLVGQCTS